MKFARMPLLAVALIAGFAMQAQAQPPAAAKAFKAPRNAFGQPDITGAWSNTTLTPQSRAASFGTRSTYTEAEVAAIEGDVARQAALGGSRTDPTKGAPPANAEVGGYNTGFLDPGNKVMRVGGQPRNSLFTTPDGRPPAPRGATGASGAGRQGGSFGGGGLAFQIGEDGIIMDIGGGGGGPFRRTDNPEQRALGERCLTAFGRNGAPPMFANGYYNNNYQIVQSRDHAVIVVEMVHDARIVRLNDRKHLPSNIRPWFGDSVGWYEGDALVVETTNLPRTQQFMGSWENLKVTERFQRVANNRMLYQFTVEDPTLWDKPWGGEYEMAALGGIIYEYACHEGNYALEGMLAGSRQDEAAEALAQGGRGR